MAMFNSYVKLPEGISKHLRSDRSENLAHVCMMSSEHSVNKLLGLPCPFHCSPPGRFLAMEMQGTLNLTLCIRVSYLVRLWWFEPKTLRRNRAFHSFSTTGISLPQQVCHRKRTFSPRVQILGVIQLYSKTTNLEIAEALSMY